MSERIPDEVIESVKRNSSFRSLLTGYGIEATKRGKNYFITCPFHDVDGKPESVPSCSIDIKGNLYYCFSCKAGGNIIQFVMAYEKVPFFEAVNKLLSIKSTPSKPIHKDRDRSGTAPKPEELPKLSESEEQKIFIEVIKQTTEALRSSSVARTYLKGRGLDPLHLLEHYELGFWSPELFSDIDKTGKDKLKALGFYTENDYPLFTNCVLWPLYIMNRGKVHTFYGRKTVGTGTHYQLTDRRGGMCLPKAGLNPRLPVVITESIIDGLSLFTAGITNVLPLCGTNAFHTNHSDYLKEKHFPKVFIAFNGDTPGKRGAAALSERLTAENFPVTVLELPEKKDINDMLTEWGAEKLGTWFKERIQPPEEPRPTVWEDELYKYILIGTHEYRIQGLTVHNLDRLRVNLKVYDVNNKDRFHIDSLDLYQSKSRESFIRQVQAALEGCSYNQINEEVNTLITTLEELRIINAESSGKKQYQMSDEERQEALAYLKAPNLLERIGDDIAACGLVGGRKDAQLAYIISISRFIEKAQSVLYVGRSGGGKSTIQELVTEFTPEEQLCSVTRMTGQSLFYKGRDGLRNKVLSIEEDEGMKDARYSIRVLVSRQRLSLQSTHQDPKTGQIGSFENLVEGPASVMIATTNLAAFDHETLNRFFIIYIDDSQRQTEAVMRQLDLLNSIKGLRIAEHRKRITRLHQNVQRLLKPIVVMNPLGTGLNYPPEILHCRREKAKVHALIKTVALLHQYQRPVKEVRIFDGVVKYIEVTQEDIDAVQRIAGDILRQSLDGELSKLCRDLLGVIIELVDEKYKEEACMKPDIQRWQVTITRKEIVERSKWSRWHVEEHLKELVESGYIVIRTGKRGQRFAYSLVDEEVPSLPELF